MVGVLEGSPDARFMLPHRRYISKTAQDVGFR